MDLAPGAERAPNRVRGRQGHLWWARRRAAPPRKATALSDLGKAVQPLFPWHVVEYPGLLAGLSQLFGGRASTHTIRDWIRGRRKAPKWAWALVALEAEKRATAFLHVAELAKKEAGD